MLVSRSLTRKEWRDVKRFVGMHEFPCTIDAGQFMTALHVFSHNDSFAPAKPPCIFYVEGRHLPDVRPRTEAPTGYARRTKEFLALTHTKRNKELLKFYGIDELEPASYYLRNAP
ncbi:hypothetical protein HY091_01365 [Candidatus Kaiserbacteria bacterium]|nr:hypothetical protein [Candidatus Kaiserbacteria bacterium]